MDRRSFIKQLSIGSTLLLTPLSFYQCSNQKINLSTLVGKGSEVLRKYIDLDNSFFGHYCLPARLFTHKMISGEDVFIAVRNNEIIGFTIRSKNRSNLKEYHEQLSKEHGTCNLSYDNNFGKKFQWQDLQREYNLTYSKKYSNLPQYVFYSESIKNHGLIIF